MKKTYRQNRDTGKLIEVVRSRVKDSHFIRLPFFGFISPIDGSGISSEKQLAEHNRKHGVTNDLDHLREQSQQRRPQESRAERREDIRDTMERMSSSGFHLSKKDMYDG